MRRNSRSDMPAKRAAKRTDDNTGRRRSASPERRPERGGSTSQEWKSERPRSPRASSSQDRRPGRTGTSSQEWRSERPASSDRRPGRSGSSFQEGRPGRTGASSQEWRSERPASSERRPSRSGSSFQEGRPKRGAQDRRPGRRPDFEHQTAFPRTQRAEAPVVAEKKQTRSEDIIFGVNSVLEAFKAGRGIDKVLLAEGRAGKDITEIINHAKGLNLKVSFESRDALSRISRSESHQGVVAFVSAGKYTTLDKILKKAESSGEPPFIMLLDGIQDPQNLGAIIRTALCAGVHGVVIPKDRAVGLTGTVDKASAGALSHMAVAKVTNVSQTIDELKREGFWVIGTSGDAKQSVYSYDIKGPVAVVIGSEGEGIRPLVAKKCDMLVSIPIKGKVTSLNASAAAAVVLYEIVRQRGLK